MVGGRTFADTAGPENDLNENTLALLYDQAEARAHKLLLRLLTPEQREEYEANHCRITVHSGEGKKKRIYKLSRADLQVRVFNYTGRLIENWCAFIPNEPREDTLIAQLVTLRSDPDRLRQVAEVTCYYPPDRDLSPRPVGFQYSNRYPDRHSDRYPDFEQPSGRNRAMHILRRAGYLALCAITLTPSS